MWNGKRYHSLDYHLKATFGEKLYKLSLDGGMTCPNRDGTISTGGCIFCSKGGSGDFTAPSDCSIEEKIDYAKQMIGVKFDGNRYIAYFQSFTNTYAPCNKLKQLFLPVIMRDDIAVLSIATRPDCLEDDKIKLISELASIKPVWVELGLQTINPDTAVRINRGYTLDVYDKAVKDLHSAGAEVITHIILGLPYESREDMLASVKYVGNTGSDGIKLQLLYVLEGTTLAEWYKEGRFKTLSEQEYISIMADAISVLPESVVIHRLTGDGDRNLLISPKWSGNKRRILNLINHELKIRKIEQGKFADKM